MPVTEAADPGAKAGVSLLARIDAWLADAAWPAVDAGPDRPPDALDLELSVRSESWRTLAPAALAQLHRLRKKVEVSRSLYRFYRADLSHPEGLARLSGAGAQRVCVLFVKAALVQRDPRFLNSALKMVDGVLIQEDCAMPLPVQALVGAALDHLVPWTAMKR